MVGSSFQKCATRSSDSTTEVPPLPSSRSHADRRVPTRAIDTTTEVPLTSSRSHADRRVDDVSSLQSSWVESMFRSVPTRSIDSTTEVPENLFDSLVRRGKERRKAGQHVLVARFEKSGGGIKLVHPEQVSQRKAKSSADISRRAGA